MRAVTYVGVTILGALLAFIVAQAVGNSIAASLNSSAALIDNASRQ